MPFESAIFFVIGVVVGGALTFALAARRVQSAPVITPESVAKQAMQAAKNEALRRVLDLYGPALYAWYWYRNAIEHGARGSQTMAVACQHFAYLALVSSSQRELQAELTSIADELGIPNQSRTETQQMRGVDLLRDAAAECAPGETPWSLHDPKGAHNASAIALAHSRIRATITKIASSAESAQ